MTQSQVRQAVHEEFLRLCKEHDIPVIKVRWSTRMTNLYGHYRWKRLRSTNETYWREIALSTRLLSHLDAALGTLRHEFAHYYCELKFNIIGHCQAFHVFNKRIGGEHHGRLYNGQATSIIAADKERSSSRMYYIWTCIHGHVAFKKRRISTAGRYFSRCRCLLDGPNVTLRYGRLPSDEEE